MVCYLCYHRTSYQVLAVDFRLAERFYVLLILSSWCYFRQLQYLTKKYLKKHNVRYWLRVIASNKKHNVTSCATSKLLRTRAKTKTKCFLSVFPLSALNQICFVQRACTSELAILDFVSVIAKFGFCIALLHMSFLLLVNSVIFG